MGQGEQNKNDSSTASGPDRIQIPDHEDGQAGLTGAGTSTWRIRLWPFRDRWASLIKKTIMSELARHTQACAALSRARARLHTHAAAVGRRPVFQARDSGFRSRRGRHEGSSIKEEEIWGRRPVQEYHLRMHEVALSWPDACGLQPQQGCYRCRPQACCLVRYTFLGARNSRRGVIKL